jgi:hypothetical protein
MEDLKQKPTKYSPPGLIYLSWTGLFFFYCIIFIPLASIGHSGGEQVPFTLFAIAIGPTIWGYLLISIITTVFFHKWLKDYWILNLIVFVITGLILMNSFIK